MAEVEPAKKILLPYLQRADELQKHEPLVAYYCRLYAMERGLKIPAKERTKITNTLLVSLMNQLEKDKKTIQVSPDDNLHVEGFALSVFNKADKQDRAGRADLNTAKNFYAASIFLEILYQFGPLQPDLEQKQKYAVWKAANIRKALNEGRRPVPGPPGGEGLEVDSGTEDAKLPDAKELGREDKVVPQELNELPVSSSKPTVFTSSDIGHFHGTQHEALHQPVNLHLGSFSESYNSYASQSVSSPPPQALQYGTGPHIDEYNAYSYNLQYHQQKQDGYSSHPCNPNYQQECEPAVQNPNSYPGAAAPNVYSGVNGSPDGSSYYSSPSAKFQNKVLYPLESILTNENFNDVTGIERTSSAPAIVKGGSPTYQLPPEKIAEAQKAARFAVSALAFDDVPTAVSYLQQSLQLLTNPSAQ